MFTPYELNNCYIMLRVRLGMFSHCWGVCFYMYMVTFPPLQSFITIIRGKFFMKQCNAQDVIQTEFKGNMCFVRPESQTAKAVQLYEK